MLSAQLLRVEVLNFRASHNVHKHPIHCCGVLSYLLLCIIFNGRGLQKIYHKRTAAELFSLKRLIEEPQQHAGVQYIDGEHCPHQISEYALEKSVEKQYGDFNNSNNSPTLISQALEGPSNHPATARARASPSNLWIMTF